MSGKWHSGPPPSCGWWPVRIRRMAKYSEALVGWWDGIAWSPFCWPYMSPRHAADNARRHGAGTVEEIEWQHRPKSWPERSKT